MSLRTLFELATTALVMALITAVCIGLDRFLS